MAQFLGESMTDSLDKVVRSALDHVYTDWLREELDRRLKGHLETLIATAVDAATRNVAQKLLEIAIREAK